MGFSYVKIEGRGGRAGGGDDGGGSGTGGIEGLGCESAKRWKRREGRMARERGEVAVQARLRYRQTKY